MIEYGADLTGLFWTPGAQQFEVLQGQVKSWNEVTGESVVTVNGVDFNNLPFLNPGTLVYLLPGDAVMVLRMRHALFLLGRTVAAGAANAVGRVTTVPGFAVNPTTTTGHALTTTMTTRCSASLNVPPWATRLTFTVNCWARGINSTASTDWLNARFSLAGDTVVEATSPSVDAGRGAVASIGYSSNRNVTPGATMALELGVAALGAGWAASASNACFFSFLPIWTST